MTRGELVETGVMRVDSDYHIIRQTMPYPMGDTNVFLIESGDGWTVIDVGVDLESTRRVWEKAMKEVGISFKQVQRIYITHCHPDHLGAARWLQHRCDAPVFMLREEIARAQKYIFLDANDFKKKYWQAIEQEIVVNGFPKDKIDELLEDWFRNVRPLYLEPNELFAIDAGDIIELGGNRFEVVRAPGHSDGQFMFWSVKQKQLFLADVLASKGYLHFSDWPNTSMQNPLEDLFDLIEQLGTMGVVKAFPGHGPVIYDLEAQLEKLTLKHQHILDKAEKIVTRPLSAGEIYMDLFQVNEYVHSHRVVMGETVGYLNYLVSKDRLRMNIQNGAAVYLPVK